MYTYAELYGTKNSAIEMVQINIFLKQFNVSKLHFVGGILCCSPIYKD